MRTLLGILLAVPVLLALPVAARAGEGPQIVVFYEEGCPDCQRMEVVLEEVLALHPGLEVARYEATQPGVPELWWKVASAHGLLPTQVPMIFVGSQAIVGAGRTEELRLRTAVEACAASPCTSPLDLARVSAFPWVLLLVLGGALLLGLLVAALF